MKTFYVDSINGNDSNDGLTKETALKTFDSIFLQNKYKNVLEEDVTIYLNPKGKYTYSKEAFTVTQQTTSYSNRFNYVTRILSYSEKLAEIVIPDFSNESSMPSNSNVFYSSHQDIRLTNLKIIGFYMTVGGTSESSRLSATNCFFEGFGSKYNIKYGNSSSAAYSAYTNCIFKNYNLIAVGKLTNCTLINIDTIDTQYTFYNYYGTITNSVYSNVAKLLNHTKTTNTYVVDNDITDNVYTKDVNGITYGATLKFYSDIIKELVKNAILNHKLISNHVLTVEIESEE